MSAKNIITPPQCRAGRALIQMTQGALAEAASVSKSVIVDFEKGHRVPNRNNLAAIQRALEEAGIEFIDRGARLAG